MCRVASGTATTRRQSVFAGDDGAMAHLPTGLSNDSRDRQEERCPARVRVGSNENISRAAKFLCGKVMIPVLRSGKIMLPDLACYVNILNLNESRQRYATGRGKVIVLATNAEARTHYFAVGRITLNASIGSVASTGARF